MSEYICTGCGHNIPLSQIQERHIIAGLKTDPELCHDCYRLQEALADEVAEDIRDYL